MINYLKLLFKKVFLSNYSYTQNNELISESDNTFYISALEKINNNSKDFNSFRSNYFYQTILENVSYDQGNIIFDLIKGFEPNYKKIIDEIKFVDKVGSPILRSYDEIGQICPSTLRYLKIALEIKSLLGTNFETVAEIGCGFGGQALILDKILKIKNYHFYDLPPALDLTKKYLQNYIFNGAYSLKTLNENDGCINYDLLISNYAFSELPVVLQLKYIDKILAKSKNGYMIMNSGKRYSDNNKRNAGDYNKLSIDEIKKHIPSIKIIDENPLTSPHNYTIIWGDKIKL